MTEFVSYLVTLCTSFYSMIRTLIGDDPIAIYICLIFCCLSSLLVFWSALSLVPKLFSYIFALFRGNSE